jgi:hypothetical protein
MSNRPLALQNPDDYDTQSEFSLNLQVGREKFDGLVGQGDLIKTLYETEQVRYLVIFDTDLQGTCNENAVRRVEYDYITEPVSVSAKDEVHELLINMQPWFERLAIEAFSIVCAPWERRDLSRFDEKENADGEPAEAMQNWRADTAAAIESLENKYSFIEETVLREHDDVTDVEILPDRFVEQARFGVDDEHYRPEIVASVYEEPPVKVDEEILFYRNGQPGEVVGELEIPDSLQPLLRSYLDQLEDVLEETIGGFEIAHQAIEL